jgi:hypothetical protein
MHGLYLLWFVHERQLPPALVASVLAAGDLSFIAFEIPTGWLADRFGHVRSLIVGSLAQVAGMLCCWLGDGLTAFVVASVLIALGDAFRSGADQALLYRSCEAAGCVDAFQAIESRTRAIEQAALVALVLIGGGIVHVWGFAAGWAAETVLCGAGLVIAIAMVEPPAGGSPTQDRSEDHRAGMASHRIAALVFPAAVLSAGSSATSFLVQTINGYGAARMSALVATIAMAEAVGSAAAMYLPWGSIRAQWALLSVGVVLGTMVFTWSSLLAAGVIGLSFLTGVAVPLRAAAIQRIAAEGWRARAASAAGACDMLLSTLALPLAGIWGARR